MNGILLIDKPSDWTSNDVVIKLKGMLLARLLGAACKVKQDNDLMI